MLDLPAFKDFCSAASGVLDYLHRRIGFDLWMVTRVSGDDWIILQVEDQSYGIKPGEVFRFADTFCSRMIESEGPVVAPRSEMEPAYAIAGIGKQVRIGAYIGVPLVCEDGSLFGTLCAIHPAPQPDQIVLEQPLVELFARLLATILTAELKNLGPRRQAERARMEHHCDGETGLFDSTAWRELLAAEEARCRTYAHPASVLMLDVPQLGAEADFAVQRPREASDLRTRVAADAPAVADALRAATRGEDVIARLAPGRFAMLLVECDRTGADAVLGRVADWLGRHHVPASMGVGHRTPNAGLEAAWRTAEENLHRRDV